MATRPSDAFSKADPADEAENGSAMPHGKTAPSAPAAKKSRSGCGICIAIVVTLCLLLGLLAADLQGLMRAQPANMSLVLSPPDSHAQSGAVLAVNLDSGVIHGSITHKAELSKIVCHASLAGVGVADASVPVATVQLDRPVAIEPSATRVGGSATLCAPTPPTPPVAPRLQSGAPHSPLAFPTDGSCGPRARAGCCTPCRLRATSLRA